MKKRSGNKLSNFTSTLRSKGKGLCAAALCTTLVLNNIGSSVVSAAAVEKNNNGSMATASDATPSDATVSKENGVYEFELTRQVLYDALQESIANDWQAAPLEAYGDYAGDYDSFFEEYGNVYQLKPDIKGSDRKVSLEIYALVEDEIELDSEYMVNGDEQFLFLLTNKSDQEQKAEIFVEDKHTGVVKLVTEATVKSDDFEGSEIVIETGDSKEEADAPTEESKESSDSCISSDSPEGDMPDVAVVGDDEIVISTGDSDDSEKETTAAADEMTGEEESKDVVVENATTEKSEDVEEENNDDEEISIAAISRHEAAWVMATPSNAEEVENDDEETEEAETATPSDAEDKDLLDVELYDAVITEDGAATGLLILAEEMGLDDADLVHRLKSYTAEVKGDDGVIVSVTATAKPGAIDDKAEFRVKWLKEEGDKEEQETLQAAKDALNADADTPEYTDMLALDIGFWTRDAGGNEVEVEPNFGEEVKVSINLNTEVLPEIDLDTVAVHHLVEDENQEIVKVENVADMTSGTAGTVILDEVDEVPVAVAEFTVESFSTFTITWNTSSTPQLVLKTIATDGSDIGSEVTYEKTGNANWITLEDIVGLHGYSFQRAVVADRDATDDEVRGETESITGIRYNNRKWYYRKNNYDNRGTELANTKSVYLIYKPSELSNDPVKVYVYVAGTGLSNECLDLLGIDNNTLDGNGYFPAGEITLSPSYFQGKLSYDVNTAGRPLINNEDDWTILLDALGEMNTSTLADQRSWNYPGANSSGKKDYSVNRGNHVGDYLDQAQGDINYTWGSQHTALFRWHDNPAASGNAHYGFMDQSVKYHLDLFFTTNKIEFILGNNGISWPSSAVDGTTVDTRTYITGSEIQPPRELNIPDGYYFDGYYTDYQLTKPWNGIGTRLNKDEIVYIKLSKDPVLALTITKEVEDATVDQKDYSFSISTTSDKVKGKSYRTSQGSYVSFSDNATDGFYTATVTMKATNQSGVDGSAMILGLPTGVTYIITEDPSSAVIEGYNCEATYTVNGEKGNTVTTGVGSTATTSATVAVTNRYTPSNKTLTIEKTVTGNMGNTNQPFNFELVLTKNKVSYTDDIDIVGKTDEKLKAENGKYSIALKNNESITLSIPDGVNYTITELDAEEYDTLYRVDHEGEFIKVNGEVTGTLNKNTVVTFHNKREVVSPTGLLTENLPYLMMFAIASIGTVGSLYPVARKKRRKSGEE